MAVVREIGIELGTSVYRIRCGTDHSEVAELGEPIEWHAPNGKKYIAMIDLPVDADAEEGASAIESEFDHLVYEVRPIADAELEETDDLPGDDIGGEDDDDDDDDEGEEEAVTVVE